MKWVVEAKRDVSALSSLPGWITGAMEFTPDGKHLVVPTRYGIWVYETTTHQEVRMLRGHTDSVTAVAISPDGNTVASGSNCRKDKTVRIWDAKDSIGRKIHKLKRHQDVVTSVAFSPDGFTLASGSWDETICLWNVGTGDLKRTLKHTSPILSVAFSPDGFTLASGSRDKTIRLWDVETGDLKHTLTHTLPIYSVAFSPDGFTLASGHFNNTVCGMWRQGTSSTPSHIPSISSGVSLSKTSTAPCLSPVVMMGCGCGPNPFSI